MADIRLDGSPRRPDVQGVVDEVTRDRISIDGTTFVLSDQLLAFSTYTLEAVSVLGSEGAYVHAGVDDDAIVWVSVVAKPLGTSHEAFYDGVVETVEGRRATFADGTVLQLDRSVKAPPTEIRVTAVIDVVRDVVTGFRDG